MGGPEQKPSHNLENFNVADHVRALQEQASFSGGITSPEKQGPTPGEGEVPEGLVFYPGEASPRSPPDSPSQDQGEPQASEDELSEEPDQMDIPELVRFNYPYGVGIFWTPPVPRSRLHCRRRKRRD